jgi:ATP-dependent Clp protease adaptor protein ClpS
MDTVAVINIQPESKRRQHKASSKQKPEKQPPYAVIVFNDDVHSFQYVLETFQKVFGYTTEKCYILTLQIHLAGRGIVWSGPKEVAELKRDQICSSGPDFYAAIKVEFPLGVTIEPLPG